MWVVSVRWARSCQVGEGDFYMTCTNNSFVTECCALHVLLISSISGHSLKFRPRRDTFSWILCIICIKNLNTGIFFAETSNQHRHLFRGNHLFHTEVFLLPNLHIDAFLRMRRALVGISTPFTSVLQESLQAREYTSSLSSSLKAANRYAFNTLVNAHLLADFKVFAKTLAKTQFLENEWDGV